ncbi:MAG TPA: LPS export ABC transporter permease LptF, partial [Thermodesulfobacteriota bacterium]|nr:LPS export ABC transporter permease LptF [Thermodesulfobacteriota bacterium]
MKKTLYLYIWKEILPIFFIGLMTFTIILLMDKIFKLIELIINRGGNVTNILMLLLYISPSFLAFTIPVAVLLGILLTLGRLSGDSEVIAFKASGISLYQLYVPVAIFSISAYLITSFLVFYGLPWGNRGFISTLSLLAKSKPDVEVKERVFNDSFKGLVVYVDKVPVQGKKMEGILIYDERDKENVNTIFAQEGFLISSPQSQEVVLELLNGSIHRLAPQTNTYQKIKFVTDDLRIELGMSVADIERKFKEHEMSIDELKKKIEKMKAQREDTTNQEVELHKRRAVPFACIVFALIGVPLGIQPRRSGRSYGFVFSILVLLAYYISLIAFEMFAVRRVVPAFWAGWSPTFIFGGLGIYLLVKAANESPFKPAVWLIEGLDLFQKKWRKLS